MLDLGCAVGDLAAELAARGARVIGMDLNEELLAEARARGLPGARFDLGDLRALPEVVEAWRARLERMKLLRDLCGARFPRLRDDFLACLTRPDHVARARVRLCLATRPE